MKTKLERQNMATESLKSKKGLPVNLLVEGEPCLVVGGGKVALRKIGHLLEAGARVLVVSPELCDECVWLVENDEISHERRPFEADDVARKKVVFAATNDRSVNRAVLKACRARNIVCSCVDGNWREGDFTTPAITRHGNLVLTVSTGGQSCRQAKLVKNDLARHIEMIETAELVVIGTDHRHMSIEEREPFHLSGDELDRKGWLLMQLWGIHEFLILNTCNRVEIVAVASRETSTNGIVRHLMGFDRLNENQYYLKRGMQAYEHLCLVTAGMFSQSPGETYVAAQLKNALESAVENGWANSMMRSWVSSFLQVSKRIKKEAASLLPSGEIEDVALEYVQAHETSLSDKTVMVLGSGMTGKAMVKKLLAHSCNLVWCYHSNPPDVPQKWRKQVEICAFDEIADRLCEADIVISAVSAAEYVLRSGDASVVSRSTPLCIIDLGMPRNIDPELEKQVDGISVVDLDALKNWQREEKFDMDTILAQCRAIIINHKDLYEKNIQSVQGRNAT